MAHKKVTNEQGLEIARQWKLWLLENPSCTMDEAVDKLVELIWKEKTNG